MNGRALLLVFFGSLPSVDGALAAEHPQNAGSPAPDPHAAHHDTSPTAEVGESERNHVAPDAPQHFMGDMSPEQMIDLMQMNDDAPYGKLQVDQLEWRDGDAADVQAWDLDAWFGNDYNKLWLETEGEWSDGNADGRAELNWDRIISPWWSFQTGVREDFGSGPSRTWIGFGVHGLAPYFFDVDASVYVGDEGRTAARFSGEYELLITQRLVLQPKLELQAFGKADPENGIGSGFSDVELGLRLRYEVRREFAPYLGLLWDRKLGQTADFAREEGEDSTDLSFVAGVRVWF